MAIDLKVRILGTHTIECRGVPTHNGLSLPEPVAALLTSRVDGTVEVACPYYKSDNEGKYKLYSEGPVNAGTCRASGDGNGACTYRKRIPDSEVPK